MIYPQYPTHGYIHGEADANLFDPMFDYLDEEAEAKLQESMANDPTAAVFYYAPVADGAKELGVIDSLSLNAALPEALKNPIYTQGFFRSQMGKNMRVEFLVGDQMTSVEGKLLFVGSNYLLLQQPPDNKQVYCGMRGVVFAVIG